MATRELPSRETLTRDNTQIPNNRHAVSALDYKGWARQRLTPPAPAAAAAAAAVPAAAVQTNPFS